MGEYVGYELTIDEQSSLRSIHISLIQGHTKREIVRTHINYLENLSKKVMDCLRNEESMNFHNDTLRHDFQRIKKLLSELAIVLAELDK